MVAEIRSVLDACADRVLIGEIYLPFSRLALYYGKKLEGAQLPFNFALMVCLWSRMISSASSALARVKD